MSKYLYGASVQGIQGYVFETNELKSIIGASKMIESFNEEIEYKYEQNIIINAAGNIKLLFKKSEKEKLEELVKNYMKHIKQKAYGITISQAVVEFEDGGLKDAFDELEKRLHIQRNKENIPLDNALGIIKLAPKSAKSEVCKGLDMATLQKENPDGSKMPKNKKKKTAIIHADGNGLGAKIAAMAKDLTLDEDVVRVFKEFSTNLDEATKKAFEDAKANYKNQNDIRKVILGGDDMVVICNANYAMEFTNTFLKNFEKETKQLLGGNGLTASAGIAYCNHKYPFHYAVNLAEQLCIHAKNYSKKVSTTSISPSSIMFHNIQSSNFDSYSDYIKTELTFKNDKEEIRLDYGPYFLSDFDGFSKISDFLALSDNFKIKNSPLSRYRQWLTLLSEDSNQADERLKRIADMIEIKDRLFDKEKFKEKLKDFNPDMSLTNMLFEREFLSKDEDEIKKTTPIFDVIEYLSVIDYEKIEMGENHEG